MRCGVPGGRKKVRDVLCARMQADLLMAPERGDDLHTTTQRRGAVAKGRRARKGLRRAIVHLEGGMVRCEWC